MIKYLIFSLKEIILEVEFSVSAFKKKNYFYLSSASKHQERGLLNKAQSVTIFHKMGFPLVTAVLLFF